MGVRLCPLGIRISGRGAEQMNHHADFELSWEKIVVKIRGYDVDEVTELEHQLAIAIDSLR